MGGQQRTQIVGRGHSGQATEHVAQIVVRIVTLVLTGDDQRVDDGGAIAGVRMADEEPVLHAQLARPDRILDRVGIEAGVAVVQMRGQLLPAPEQTYVEARVGVEWLGCWAHARRRFFDAAAEPPETATRVLRLIGRLYQLERAWDAAGVRAQRAVLGQERFAKPPRRLRCLVSALRARVLPKSGLGQACAYRIGSRLPVGHQSTRR